MPDEVRFTVYGNQAAKREPRVRILRKGGKSIPVLYQRGDVRLWQRQVRDAALVAAGKEYWSGPVSLTIVILRSLPLSKRRKVLPNEVWCATKPDTDRLACAICDGMEKVVYGNDGQIADLRVLKLYTTGRPCVSVIARKLDPFSRTAVVEAALSMAEEIAVRKETRLNRMIHPE